MITQPYRLATYTGKPMTTMITTGYWIVGVLSGST